MSQKTHDSSMTITIGTADSATGTYQVSTTTMRKVAALLAQEHETEIPALRTPLPIKLPF